MKWDEEKIEKVKCLLEEGKRYEEISIIFKVTKKAISCLCNKHNFKPSYILYKKYNCLECGEEFKSLISQNRKFCSKSCSIRYNNKRRKHTEETKNKISRKLKKEETKKERRNN